MLKILLLTGDAGEARRSITPSTGSRKRAGKFAIAAPEKRAFLSVVHDFEPGFDTYTEKPGYRVQADSGSTR